MTNKPFKAAVIGDPIAHSLSPNIHNYWLKKYNIDGNYEAIQVAPNNLENAIKSMVNQEYCGFNVTIPHKEKVFQLIKQQGTVSNSASILKAVNTVVINSSNKLEGHNSDDFGFAKNLQNTFSDISFKQQNAFLIGAGGAARAIIFSLIIDFKVKNIFITNRTKEKFDLIYQDFAAALLLQNTKLIFVEKNDFEEQLSNCDLLINSSSLGMINQPQLKINLQNLKKSAIVYDIVYKPLMTNLLQNAQNQGNKIVTGIGMLMFQAAFGFEKWFKQQPKIDENLITLLNAVKST